MEENGTRPKIQSLESTEGASVGERRCLEEGSLSEVRQPEVTAVVEEHCLPVEASPSQSQHKTEAVEDKGADGTSSGSQKGSGSSSGSGFDADIDETDHTASVTSSADLVEAHDSALEALELGKQREKVTFIWIDKCLERVASASSDLRKFATTVLGNSRIGKVEVQSTISEGVGTPTRVDNYKERFEAVEEKVRAAYYDIAARENAKIVTLEPEAQVKVEGNGEKLISSTAGVSSSLKADTEGFCEGIAAISSKDCLVVYPGYEDTRGEGEKNNENEEKKMKTGEEFSTLTNDSDEKSAITVKTEGDVLSGGTTRTSAVRDMGVHQQEVIYNDATNSRGDSERETAATESLVEIPGDQTSPSKDNEGGTAEEDHHELDTASNTQEGTRLLEGEKQHAAKEACQRSRVLRKLVMRQQKALSKMIATAETRVCRISCVGHFLLTCVKCAACVCRSALHAYGLALIAVQVAEASCTADIECAVKEAVKDASQNTHLAIASCEKALQSYQDAARVLEDVSVPLATAQKDNCLGEHIVREVTRAAEDIEDLGHRVDLSLRELESKLSDMEFMRSILSRAVTDGKDVNLLTKQVLKTFEDSGFQYSVVADVFGATQFAVRAMSATMNALGFLSRIPGDRTEEPSCEANSGQNVASAGQGNVPKDEAPINQVRDPQNVPSGGQGNTPAVDSDETRGDNGAAS